jgi:hypothetical protein
MECWNLGILEEDSLGRDERLLVQGTQARAPPRADIRLSHHSTIPIFQHSTSGIHNQMIC